MWPEHGAHRDDTSETHKKSPVAAKRCVLQRWHWSAKLIFRTFHLLWMYLGLILDDFLLGTATRTRHVSSRNDQFWRVWPFLAKISKTDHDFWPKFGSLDGLPPLPHQPLGIPWDNSENWEILIFVPKNGPILGKIFQKSGAAAKRCVLQRLYWSAKLIFRTFHLLGRCLAVILDHFYCQMRPEHWVCRIALHSTQTLRLTRRTQCSGLIWQ